MDSCGILLFPLKKNKIAVVTWGTVIELANWPFYLYTVCHSTCLPICFLFIEQFSGLHRDPGKTGEGPQRLSPCVHLKFPGVNLLVGTENGLMLLDRSGQGKVYNLINRRRFQQMDVLEGLNVLVTISGMLLCWPDPQMCPGRKVTSWSLKKTCPANHRRYTVL